MKRQQTGFTLVEIAIVLVIIGLLLGGVLKGQELINSAKSKAVVNDFRNTMTMIAAYQDRFKALPGDDAAASQHLPGATAADNGDGNGLVGGAWRDSADTGKGTSEARLLWRHLRLANLATGTADMNSGDFTPHNGEGGVIGVQSYDSTKFAGMNGRLVICQDQVSGRVALQADTTMDDGAPSTGSVQFGSFDATGKLTPVTTTGNTPTFKESDLYAICVAF